MLCVQGFAGFHACLLSGTERTVLFTGHTAYAYSIGFTMCKETHIRRGRWEGVGLELGCMSVPCGTCYCSGHCYSFAFNVL